MKKILILVSIIFLSCDNREDSKQELLNSTHRLSTTKFKLEVKKMLLTKDTITPKKLDSIGFITDKYCDSVVNKAFEQTTLFKPVVTSMWGY